MIINTGGGTAAHADTHKTGGTDALAPGDIGAAADSHTHTLASIGAAPAYTYGTADLTAGTSALETGKLYFVYE